MGEQDVEQVLGERQQRAYMKALLEDLRPLELMLEGDLLESGVHRIGSEQEMFLVDAFDDAKANFSPPRGTA